MAIALVQSKPFVTDGGGTGYTVAFDNALKVGNLITVQVARYNGSFSPSGSVAGALTKVVSNQDGGGTNEVGIWYKVVATAGIDTITLGDGFYLTGVICEWSGVDTTSPLKYQTIGGGPTYTANIAAQGDLLLQAQVATFGANPLGMGYTGFPVAATALYQQQDSNSFSGFQSGYLIGGTSSPRRIETTSTASGTYNGVIAAFRLGTVTGPTYAEADATVSNSDTTAADGGLIANSTAALANSDTTAMLATAVKATVGTSDNTETGAYTAGTFASGVAALSQSDVVNAIGGAFRSGQGVLLNDAAVLFDSNAIASGAADMSSTNDAAIAFTATAIGGANADLTQSDLTTMVSAAIIAAGFASSNDSTLDGLGTFFRTGVALLVLDAIALFTNEALPGDGGTTNPAGSLRRMRRIPTSRSMQRIPTNRTMTR